MRVAVGDSLAPAQALQAQDASRGGQSTGVNPAVRPYTASGAVASPDRTSKAGSMVPASLGRTAVIDEESCRTGPQRRDRHERETVPPRVRADVDDRAAGAGQDRTQIEVERGARDPRDGGGAPRRARAGRRAPRDAEGHAI